MTRLVIAKVKGLPARIGHWIVVPWGEAVLVRVLAPAVAATTLGNDGSECRVSQHVDPRRGGHLARRCVDDVLASIGSESAEAVEENQVAMIVAGRRGRIGAMWPDRRQTRYQRFRRTGAIHLLGQGAATGLDDHSAAPL